MLGPNGGVENPSIASHVHSIRSKEPKSYHMALQRLMERSASLKSGFKELLQKLLDENQFHKTIGGIRLQDLEVGHAETSLKVTRRVTNIYGLSHGGLYFTLCDATGWASAMTYVDNKKAVVVTVTTSSTFVGAAEIGDTLICRAHVINVDKPIDYADKKLFFVMAKVTNQTNKKIYEFQATFQMIPRPTPKKKRPPRKQRQKL